MHISKMLIRGAVALGVVLAPAIVMQGTAIGWLDAAQAASTETVRFSSASGSKEIEIVRGDPVRALPATAAAQSREQLSYQPVSGMNGWFVDPETGRIGNCFRSKTTQVKGWRIKCVWKDMR